MALGVSVLAVDSRGRTVDFISLLAVTAKLHTGFWVKSQQREEAADPAIHQHGIKRPPMVLRLLC